MYAFSLPKERSLNNMRNFLRVHERTLELARDYSAIYGRLTLPYTVD